MSSSSAGRHRLCVVHGPRSPLSPRCPAPVAVAAESQQGHRGAAPGAGFFVPAMLTPHSWPALRQALLALPPSRRNPMFPSGPSPGSVTRCQVTFAACTLLAPCAASSPSLRPLHDPDCFLPALPRPDPIRLFCLCPFVSPPPAPTWPGNGPTEAEASPGRLGPTALTVTSQP